MKVVCALIVILGIGLAAWCCADEQEQVLHSWGFEDGKTEGWRWKENAKVDIREDETRKSKVYHLTSTYAPFNFTWTTNTFPDRDFTKAQWIDFWICGDNSKSVVRVTLGKTPSGQAPVYYQNSADAITVDFTGWRQKRVWLHRFATPQDRKRSDDLRAMSFLQFFITSEGAPSVDVALDDIRLGSGGKLPDDIDLWQAEYARMEEKELPRDGSNLLANGGFELHNEKSPHFWSLSANYDGEAAIDTATAHTGKASVRLTCPGKRQSAHCGISRSLQPGRYRLTGWYRTSGVPDIRRAGAGIALRYSDVDRKLCGIIEVDLPPSEGKWTRFDRSIPAPWNIESGSITLQMQKVPGTVWWDDVSLAWDTEHAQALARQAEVDSNMLGKAVMGMERCVEALKAVDALTPSDEAEARAIALVKAAFQWSIDDAERAINAKMSDEARQDLEEALERIKNAQPIIKGVAEAIRKAKPTAVVEGNPYVEELDNYAEALKPVEKLRDEDAYVRDAPWPKGLDGFKSVKDAWFFRSMGAQSFVLTWALARPECKGFASAKLLPRVFCLFDAILSNHMEGEWIMGRSVPYHYDTNIQRFTLGPMLDAYWMIRETFPSLIPARKKRFWEEQIALCVRVQYDTYGAESIDTGVGGSGDYPNMDVYYLYIMELAARLLNEPKYHEDSEKFMRFLQKKIYPMGATAYHGTQNECGCYHDLIVCMMGRYYEITKSGLAGEILKAMKPFYPLNIEPGGVPEYYTDCWWKHYWGTTPCHGPEVMAGFTGDGMNKYLADEIRKIRGVGRDQYTPITASWYRTDIKPVKPPDNYVIYDLNTLGPHGRYGDFSFGGTTRKALPGEHGRDTFVGAMLVGLEKAGTLESALQLVTTEVRYKVSNERRDARFVSGDEQSWVTIGKDCGGLSTDYAVTRPGWDLRSTSIPWRGRQTWFLGKRRLIGLLSMAPTEDQEMAAVRGRIRLGLKAKPTDPERLRQIDGTTFQYGEKLNVRIHDHNFARIFSEPSETFYVDPPDRFRSTEIVLSDPQSEKARGNPVTYGKGTCYHFLVEVFPGSSKPAQRVKRIGAGQVCGLTFTDEEGEFAVIHNPGETDVTYDLSVESRGARSVRIYREPDGEAGNVGVVDGRCKVVVGAQKHVICLIR